ncbi:hypothetical protein Pan216_30970 [Planctomycetes bacterium Pan216]|uniref:DUF2760 domain-containing protein n=1 Tax=Kolteria novifilia TaxID=2527975 RepID=A0A518B5I2_9BACT|nr:hypothetical protein Pan216_30970 [Planctomycetes bacterium Pan216]
MGRLGLAFKAFFQTLTNADFADKVETLALPAPAEPKEEKPTIQPELVGLLALFQREGRLIDFLKEDLGGFGDAQIGAAARSVHEGCRKALEEHISLEPILSESEGASVSVPAGFDPATIRVVGQVAGDPPFQGTLQHHGWKIAEGSGPVSLPKTDQLVVAPAEVEIP